MKQATQHPWSAILALILTATLALAAHATTVSVSTPDEAQKAIDAAKPGDEVLLADGIHSDFRIKMSGKGTADKPIVFRAANPGKAVLTGKVRINIQGQHLAVRDLIFDQAWGSTVVAFIGATECLLADCAFIECGNPKSTFSHIVSLRKQSCRNTVERIYMNGNMSMGVGVFVPKKGPQNTGNRIAWNWFQDIVRRSNNGQESVQLGQGATGDTAVRAIVEHNLFVRASGDAEIISSKSAYNILRHNTFRECKAQLVLRYGNHVRVEGNWFFGQSGIRAYGTGQRIVNNYIEGGSTGISTYGGGKLANGDILYLPFVDSLIAHNTIVDCSRHGISVGVRNGHPALVEQIPSKNCKIVNNIIVGSRGDMVVDGGDKGNTYSGNIAYPTSRAKVGYEGDGVLVADPKLEKVDGIWRLTKNSLAVNAGAPIGDLDNDIEGQKRDGKPDTGCDEISGTPVRYPPLEPKNVGPRWMAGDPSAIARIPNPQPTPKIQKRKKAARIGKKPHPVATKRNADGSIVVQVEDFALFNKAEVQTVEGAAGGKAVLMKAENSQAEATVDLEPGTYIIQLDTRSNGSDHDAIYFSLAGQETRSYRSDKGFGPVKGTVGAKIAKGGPQNLIVRTGEDGVLADQIVIRRAK